MFQSPATIEQVATRVDGTLKITVSTQELAPQEMTELFKLKGKMGWLLFKENEIKVEDIPDEQAPEFKNDKTPSQRLRSVLYVYWDQKTAKQITFNQFYDQWIEKKVKEIKDTLN